MQKAYPNRINWENYPSDKTPINETNLNQIDYATDEIDNRVISLDTTKASKIEVAPLIANVTFNEKTGIFTFTKKDGSTFTVDTLLEKIIVNFSFDRDTQKIILTMEDGKKEEIDLSAFIAEYEFVDSDTVAFTLLENHKITAQVKTGSITEDYLQPNYLADIKVAQAKAEAAQDAAETAQGLSETAKNQAQTAQTAAETAETNAQSAQTAAETAETNAQSAQTAAETARNLAQTAAANANSSKTAAQTAQTAAETAEANASNSASSASNSAGQASISASAAAASESNAEDYATLSKSWAQGGTGARIGEATNNAKYWAELAASYAVGGMHWMGSINYAEIPSTASVGDLYNIKDEFTTDSRFDEGSGVICPAGTDIVMDNNGKWDVLVPAGVISFNGRKGNVVPASGDYSADMISYGVTSNVESALDGKIAPKYGICSTKAATAEKIITLTDTDFRLIAGAIICVKFSSTNTAQNPKFNVNGTGAKPVWCNTALITTGNLGYAGTANRPMQFTYDGTQWIFTSWSIDNNTTYSAMSTDELITGTATASRVVRADYLKDAIEQIAENKNTDSSVTQTITDTTNADYRVLFSGTADNTTRTEGVRKDKDFTYNPNTGLVSATDFSGNGTKLSEKVNASKILTTVEQCVASTDSGNIPNAAVISQLNSNLTVYPAVGLQNKRSDITFFRETIQRKGNLVYTNFMVFSPEIEFIEALGVIELGIIPKGYRPSDDIILTVTDSNRMPYIARILIDGTVHIQTFVDARYIGYCGFCVTYYSYNI